MSSASDTDRERQRTKYRARIARALNEDDDPLAAYHQFIQWTIKNYGDKDPQSGLSELLKEGTNQFKDDPMYKTDLRYLKMWALYAMQLDRSGAIAVFKFLVKNDIGTSYSALYEDFANLLEKEGRRQEAEELYLKGIKRLVRPLERLKTRYKEFQARGENFSSTAVAPRTKPPTSQSRSASTPSVISTTATSTSSANLISFNSTPASRYALMLAPPPPGKRPEKLRFHMGLLFTDEGVEYSIQEARARSMGLLGKKWGPPPPSETRSFASSSSSSSSSARVDFNDDGSKSTRLMSMGRRRSLLVGGGAEPTVTINTKEALADVFGMYNSPDKTTKLTVPGSKHAPLKKIEPVTPVVQPRSVLSRENNDASKTPNNAFRPFVDENAQLNRTTPGVKFTPFKDNPNKTPFITPGNVFAVNDASTPAALGQWPNENPPRSSIKPLRSVSEDKPSETVFSKVFIPVQSETVPLAPLRDVFTDDHGKPMPKPKPTPTHERAKSHHDISSGDGRKPSPAFIPFLDENAKTPFKVFSRPPQSENPSNAQNVLAPKTPTSSVFTPYTDPKPAAFTPFKDVQAPIFTPFVDKPLPSVSTIVPRPFETQMETPSWPELAEEDDYGEHDQEDDDPDHDLYDYDNERMEQYETPLAPEHLPHLPEEYEEGVSYQAEAPLGGRFGQFNVMTPITERTFEFTTSTRADGTPSDRFSRAMQVGEGSPKSSIFVPLLRDELVAAASAKRLAAELQEDASEDYSEDDKQLLEPLHLSVDTFPQRGDPEVALIEERTGSLSLIDTLTLNSKFRPPNPCNPFDSPILTTLLSRIPTDPHFFDLRDRSSGMLAPLQKFSKKSRKTSSSSNNGMSDVFSLTLQGNRFNVSEKLGEGAFGCVFKACDLGARSGEQDDDDDDFDDDEAFSLVALKIVKPRNLWEYHVLRRLHSALPLSLRRSILLPHALYAFNDESILVLEFCHQGMLLTIVNNAVSAGVSQAGACLDELLVMFFTTELLKLLEGMHSAGIIHGDLKIDNCLLRLEEVPGGASAWSSMYQPSGADGWSYKGLKIIDFGRTIDTRLFPPGQQFIAEWATDERDCFEIQQNKSWTYQTDYFGLAGIVYCMLFGKYIQSSAISQTVTEEDRRHRISTPFKRYWQSDIWNKLFDILLNPVVIRSNAELPLCRELSSVRVEMETWLQANCNRTSNTLKGLLKKVEMACYV